MIKVSVIPFELKLKRPIQVNGESVSTRSGFRIQLLDLKRFVGVGECVPLPGLHSESLQDCKKQWEKIKESLSRAEICFDRLSLSQPFLGMWDGPVDLYPSLAFGLEQALLNLFLAAHPEAFEEIFRVSGSVFSARVNGLFIPTERDLERVEIIAQDVLAKGFQVLKIKVGRFPLQRELSLIQSLNHLLKGRCRIRLDGNGLFYENDFQNLTEALRNEEIEYLEEPLHSSLTTSSDAYENSLIPIALDESLPSYLQRFEEGAEFPKSVRALVVKPTTLGGVHKTVNLIQLCQEKNLQCVLSSAFDTGWTIATFVLLSQLVKNETAMGFDTYKYLLADTLAEKLELSEGKVFVRKDIYINLGKRYV